MHRLKYLKPPLIPPEYRDDCKKIQQALWCSGIPVDQQECYQMWCTYSETMCAGWLIVPDDTLEIVDRLVIPYEEDE